MQGHVTIVKQLLPRSQLSDADKTRIGRSMPARDADKLEILKVFGEHLSKTSLPDSGNTTDLLTWASEDFKRHDFANLILSSSDANDYESDPQSPIERAALLDKPGVLWWLIATSPHDHATKCVERAKKLMKPRTPGSGMQQQTMAGAQLATERAGEERNRTTVLPTRQHVPSAPTNGGVLCSEVLYILEHPPFALAYKENPFENVPQPGELATRYNAHICGFFKNQSASSILFEVSSVDDVVYRRGPAKIMKERVDAEKKHMERDHPTPIAPDLYHEDNSQFTWVHLPATRVGLSYY